MTGKNNEANDSRQTPWRLGAVSYLNARPLVCGLQDNPEVRLWFDVPSRLPIRLAKGDFDAALIPAIDLLENSSRLRIVSDACIASDGETFTVRVLSRVPPDRIQHIHADAHSHTSAILARLIWPALFHREVSFSTFGESDSLEDCESVLLIGDKVVGAGTKQFRYQVDLGGAWKTWTGLPFVFAVWVAPKTSNTTRLAQILSTARDRGVKKSQQLAVEYGPRHGWPILLAQQYFQRYLQFGLTDKHAEGMIRFFDLATTHKLLPRTCQLQSI